ncbi:DUF1998 domain-containing protein [Sorangium sp. wiwo2]|uniref:DUF1998 domain-containing protein n=2 Tax=Sorangium atrum TaxID=2995308 RepID=A0ABT5CEF9_9BACT|nr:DUF1998 domain-containing protein [Sorangium aterium]
MATKRTGNRGAGARKGRAGGQGEGPAPPDGHIRRSQAVTTFGPGALVDLPARSGIVSGPDHWGDPAAEDSRLRRIEEPRLLAHLAEAGITGLYTPPAAPSRDDAKAEIPVWELPRWFLVDPHAPQGEDRARRSRRMVHRSAFEGMTWGGRPVVPIRFVQACIHGHVGDVDWMTFVHRGESNCEALYLDEVGTTGDFAEIFVRCACRASRALLDAIPRHKDDSNEMPLGMCPGGEPWLGPLHWRGGPGRCDAPARLLVRSATNAYFPELMTAISIPGGASLADRMVAELWEEARLEVIDTGEALRLARKLLPKLEDAFKRLELDDANVLAAIERRRRDRATAQGGLKGPEIARLLSEDLGVDKEESELFATEVALPEPRPPRLQAVRRVLSVHRLREVVALIGFTRIDQPTRDAEGALAVGARRARLSAEARWVPAVENQGEGLFVALDPGVVVSWMTRPKVEQRETELRAGFVAWAARHADAAARFPGVAYVMLHSLSHLLLTAVALECGYAASSIRERVYAGPEGYGVLLYTATADAEGTLGGLAGAAGRLDRHLQAALAYGSLCSNDPVCAQHEPRQALEERFLHGAACHGCLLLPETSCEHRNELLDRALVMPTVEPIGAELFGPDTGTW